MKARNVLIFMGIIACAFILIPAKAQMGEMGDSMATSMGNGSINDLNGSGTGRLPQSSRMWAIHAGVGGWSVMNHGSAFGRFTDQNAGRKDGQRGGSAADGPNWVMTMWERRLGDIDQLRLRGMFSLDPLTETNKGYPLLFQTGESYKGRPLIDTQHPHDLFMELSSTWFRRIGDRSGFFAYFALPGEPALGPTTYMHRPSAEMNPDAPLGHHWQDATHITFGVFTLGAIIDDVKLDVSIFTGREPDDNRWNFDRPRFDSYGGRVSYRFLPGLVAQLSSAYLHSPEGQHPDINQVRMTGSIETSWPISEKGAIASSIVYGGNIELEHGFSDWTHSVLAESELGLGRLVPYGRFEFVQKSGRDLGIAAEPDRIFGNNAITLGSAVRIFDFLSLSLFAGAQGTMNIPDRQLRGEYGRIPLSYEVFVRLRPTSMHRADMAEHRH